MYVCVICFLIIYICIYIYIYICWSLMDFTKRRVRTQCVAWIQKITHAGIDVRSEWVSETIDECGTKIQKTMFVNDAKTHINIYIYAMIVQRFKAGVIWLSKSYERRMDVLLTTYMTRATRRGRHKSMCLVCGLVWLWGSAASDDGS